MRRGIFLQTIVCVRRLKGIVDCHKPHLGNIRIMQRDKAALHQSEHDKIPCFVSHGGCVRSVLWFVWLSIPILSVTSIYFVF